ncbi:MAG: ATPase, partial [Bacteroidetes bacterium]|nr:ATPase [Bacteroidota bacterium]
EKNFTNRLKETEQLAINFISLINTILISPRRWGKSSLVVKAAETALKKDEKLRFCMMDMNNIRTEEQFYRMLAQEVLRISSSKVEGIMETAKKFIVRFIPVISFSPASDSDFSISMDWKEVNRQPDEILNLAERIATDKKLKFVVCIDEFQNISQFADPLSFQKKLRSHWQKHRNTCYCLYGSKRHMMMDVFTSSSMPFYKFGDIIFLDKITRPDWIQFLKKRFRETGKKIESRTATLIADLADCHPYYVQQLAQQAWLRTDKECTSDIVITAHNNLAMQLSLLFQTITDSLSTTQINFIRAVLSGVRQLSSKDVIREFRLGTSANVQRIKKTLINKEIIDIQTNTIYLLDPMYQYWLRKYYFKL